MGVWHARDAEEGMPPPSWKGGYRRHHQARAEDGVVRVGLSAGSRDSLGKLGYVMPGEHVRMAGVGGRAAAGDTRETRRGWFCGVACHDLPTALLSSVSHLARASLALSS